MRYGLPCKGSKNAIARWLAGQLPPGGTFVDAFCGGGAATHAAMLSGKWGRFVMNDLDGRLPQLFVDCVHGKHTVESHPEWISRGEFHRRKGEDGAEGAYVMLVWSFGNNGQDYIYGAGIEQFKHDYHRAVYEDDPGLLRPYGYDVATGGAPGIYERYLGMKRQIGRQGAAAACLESLERLRRLEGLQHLEGLHSLRGLQSLQRPGRLETHALDYRDLAERYAGRDRVLYCDIPYEGTSCGRYSGFDHGRFYEWARGQDGIYISSYAMPEGFVELARTRRTVHSSVSTVSTAVERIFTNERTFREMDAGRKEMYALGLSEQMAFDWARAQA